VQDLREKIKKLLIIEGIDINSEIDFEVNNKLYRLSFEYIIDSYMKASKESQEVFVLALEKAIDSKNMGVDKFFEGMGQLLLMTHLSDKIEL
jgi:hypothetical protein